MDECPLILAPSILNTCFKANGYPMGLPEDPAPAFPPLGFEGTTKAIADQQGIMGQAFDNTWQAFENVFSGIYSTSKKVIGAVYSDVRDGAGTVYDDVSKPVNSALTGSYWYLIGAVVVVGGALYFIGKTGAIKVRV